MTASPHSAGKGSRRGGARNDGGRVTSGLTYAQAQTIISAASFAVAAGVPLNRHTTIHFGRLGFDDSRCAAAVTRFTKLVREWLAKKGVQTAFLWVRESRGGPHVHLVWHLPPGVAIRRQTRTWVHLLAGHQVPSRSVKTRIVRGWRPETDEQDAIYWSNLGHLIAYLLKGCDPDAVATLGLSRGGLGGKVIGKRCGTSNNVGRTMRKAAAVRESHAGCAKPNSNDKWWLQLNQYATQSGNDVGGKPVASAKVDAVAQKVAEAKGSRAPLKLSDLQKTGSDQLRSTIVPKAAGWR